MLSISAFITMGLLKEFFVSVPAGHCDANTLSMHISIIVVLINHLEFTENEGR